MEKVKKYAHVAMMSIAIASIIVFVTTFFIDEIVPQPEIKIVMYISALTLALSAIILAEKF